MLTFILLEGYWDCTPCHLWDSYVAGHQHILKACCHGISGGLRWEVKWATFSWIQVIPTWCGAITGQRARYTDVENSPLLFNRMFHYALADDGAAGEHCTYMIAFPGDSAALDKRDREVLWDRYMFAQLRTVLCEASRNVVISGGPAEGDTGDIQSFMYVMNAVSGDIIWYCSMVRNARE